jgi:tetratricopeptide (TPR) repeat protein
VIVFNGHIINGEKVESAMRSSATAQAALAAGDTPIAAEEFRKAGESLEEHLRNANKLADFSLIRFLAATSYFKGGHYPKAQWLCKQIREFTLPAEVKPLFAQFSRDVKERADPKYGERARKEILRLGQRDEYAKVVEMLQEHPFVLNQFGLAFIRAICCERLKDYRTAALFWADALKHNSEDPGVMFASGLFPLYVALNQGNHHEAWKYVELLLVETPNAMTYLTAASIRFVQAVGANSDEERRRFSEDHNRYFEEGWRRFQRLPERYQNDSDLREMVTLAFYAATSTYQGMEMTKEAREISDIAVKFNPNSPLARTARGIMTYPSKEAVEDFRIAAERNEESYCPYFYLAHDAMMAKEFKTAISWCEQARRRHPSERIAAKLELWQAHCEKQIHGNGETAETFMKPQEAEVGNGIWDLGATYAVQKRFSDNERRWQRNWGIERTLALASH